MFMGEMLVFYDEFYSLRVATSIFRFVIFLSGWSLVSGIWQVLSKCLWKGEVNGGLSLLNACNIQLNAHKENY